MKEKMEIRMLSSATDLVAYDTWVKSHPHGNLWQSLEWKKFQESLGREVRVYAAMNKGVIEGSALVIIDTTIGGFSTWDIPRGPLWLMENGELRMENFMEHIIKDAKQDNCISLYLSPIQPLILNLQFSILNSSRHIHASATRIIDLTKSEDEILAQMEPKGRYNIKVARKHGVRIEQSTDIDAFYALLRGTGGRDRFAINPKVHYACFLEKLDGSFLLLAFSPSSFGRGAVAGLMGVTWPTSAKATAGNNKTGFYYYGASDYASRNMMAPYLLQWEAMKRCKAEGCRTYDLLGIAPPGSGPDHHWAGISIFKEKFGGAIIEYAPEQELILKPMMRELLRMKRSIVG